MLESPLIEELGQRRISLLGLGVENRALARFLLSRNIPFSVCDRREPEDLDALWREYGDQAEEWCLGPRYLEGLERFQVIFRTPGISALRPELRRARAQGVQLSSQTRLFAALSPAPVLGVTGTKGKGTTTALAVEMLRDGPYRQVFSGGNIGLPPIAFLDELTEGDLVVLELSSFQLQDWDRSPHIALVLSVTCDHLDYHADRDEYVAAKRTLCRFQTADDYLIVDQDCLQARSFAAGSPACLLAFSAAAEVEAGAWVEGDRLWLRRPGGPKESICLLADIPLPGRHNWSNAAAGAAAAAVAGASTALIAAGLRRFQGLEHRLERVGEYEGVTYYNDSLATMPEATMAAIQAFSQPLVLIAGGSSKRADFAALGALIASRRVKAVILMGEEGRRIAAAIARAGGCAGEVVVGCANMAAAVAAARSFAQAGDVVLLSPACASFDMFASYQDRGEQFKCLVRDL